MRNMTFEVIKTDIIKIVADAIVCPANKHLKEGSGASAGIFQAAGRRKLTKACDSIAYCAVGSATATLAFDLNAKFIIHAVVPKWIDGEHNEYELLSSTYLSALQIADIMKCESIAFPLLASGYNGFDKVLALQIAAESINSFEGTCLKKVILVVYGERTIAFMKEQGYEVQINPDEFADLVKKAEQKKKWNALFSRGKNAAEELVMNELDLAFEWSKDPKNVNEVLRTGAAIAKIVLSKGKLLPGKTNTNL